MSGSAIVTLLNTDNIKIDDYWMWVLFDTSTGWIPMQMKTLFMNNVVSEAETTLTFYNPSYEFIEMWSPVQLGGYFVINSLPNLLTSEPTLTEYPFDISNSDAYARIS